MTTLGGSESTISEMKKLQIGSIFSVSAPDGSACEKDALLNCVKIIVESGGDAIRWFLFESLGEERLEWSYEELNRHIEDSIGPPFHTSVQRVEGDSWLGYQGVTALSETQFLVNRVIASKVSDNGARIEFCLSKNAVSESLMNIVESVDFMNHDNPSLSADPFPITA